MQFIIPLISGIAWASASMAGLVASLGLFGRNALNLLKPQPIQDAHKLSVLNIAVLAVCGVGTWFAVKAGSKWIRKNL